MLAGRLFAYADAHRYRLGVNHHQIPVNRPRNEVRVYHRDGAARSDDNGGATPNYHPNSFDGVTDAAQAALPPFAGTGPVKRYQHQDDGDYYSQAGALYRLMSDAQRALLTDNIAGALSQVPPHIQQRQVAHFQKADDDYGARVERGLLARRRA